MHRMTIKHMEIEGKKITMVYEEFSDEIFLAIADMANDQSWFLRKIRNYIKEDVEVMKKDIDKKKFLQKNNPFAS